MLLHVSVCDHHQGARTWTWLKLQLLKSSVKIGRYVHAVVWQHSKGFQGVENLNLKRKENCIFFAFNKF